MDIKTVREIMIRTRENVEKVMVGKGNEIDLMLVAISVGGHVLLEDVPGTGKTTLAKTLAATISCDFKRVQFTPDLLPTDLTGLSIYNPKTGDFTFKPGGLFTNILLADEINRATPRTQSGLLECMEEKQISIDGITYPLTPPYFVMATQNPIETQGTFPLPEAQLDRFLMQLNLGYPGIAGETDIIKRFLKGSPLAKLTSVSTREEWISIAEAVAQVAIHDALSEYISKLADFTRNHGNVVLGVSPRASLALAKACQGYAALQGRDYVMPDDIKFLAPHVWSHRLALRSTVRSGEKSKIIEEALATVPIPTEDMWK